MKKIRKQEATHLIEQGLFPVCQTSSRGDYCFVYSLAELQRLEKLCSSQLFILWGYEDLELQAFQVPSNAMDLTGNDADAIALLLKGEKICVKALGEEGEKVFQGKGQFRDFENFYKENVLYHRPFIIYWYV